MPSSQHGKATQVCPRARQGNLHIDIVKLRGIDLQPQHPVGPAENAVCERFLDGAGERYLPVQGPFKALQLRQKWPQGGHLQRVDGQLTLQQPFAVRGQLHSERQTLAVVLKQARPQAETTVILLQGRLQGVPGESGRLPFRIKLG